ncbi:MAG: hypothetical protein KY476_20140 [Planctomycetes bacterium]|nr:hypothetical protein [Planctomycetota bacterium]
MTLTPEQLDAAERGEVVSIRENGLDLVLVRREQFEQLSALVDYGEFDPRETYPLVEAAWGDDPHLDEYQQYK